MLHSQPEWALLSTPSGEEKYTCTPNFAERQGQKPQNNGKSEILLKEPKTS